MNYSDFIAVNDISWGAHPFYEGASYSKDAVVFATFGAKSGITYADIQNFSVPADDADFINTFLPMQTSGLKSYYGDGMFQRRILASQDDFLKNKTGVMFIPTSEELQFLLNNSNLYCTVDGLVIEPKVNDSVVGSILIPYNGYIRYYKSSDNMIKIAHANMEIVKFGIDKVSDYKEYSDIYLLTSDVLDNNKINVIRINIRAEVVDNPMENLGDTSIVDNEFMYFEIVQEGGYDYIVQTLDVMDTQKGMGLMVLPMMYTGSVEVGVKGELFINERKFLNFFQEKYQSTKPYFSFSPFGAPEINSGIYNDTFTMSVNAVDLSTYFYINDSTTISITSFNKSDITFINNIAKIPYPNSNNYWLLEDNENLYIETVNNISVVKFDPRNLYPLPYDPDNNKTIINIDVNINYSDPYIVPEDNFVLPSVYKPFYIKRLYSIETFGGEYDLNTMISVYNGIGMFAQEGVEPPQPVNPTPNVPDGDRPALMMMRSSGYNSGSVGTDSSGSVGTGTGYGGGGGSSSSGSSSSGSSSSGSSSSDSSSSEKDDVLTDLYGTQISEDLYNQLTIFFNGDTTFGDNLQFYYDNTTNLYVVGLLNDTFTVYNGDDEGETKLEYNDPMPIFRDKPLLLCDYSDGVFDAIDQRRINSSWDGLVHIFLTSGFTTVQEPYYKLKLNREQSGDIKLNFGNLFNKIDTIKCGAGTIENYPSCIGTDVVNTINEGNKKGIRYYLVNEAFYSNYVYNLYYYSDIEPQYKQEYINNREYYDLFPYKVNFKNTNIWDDETVDNYYVPFFDMIPALKNTKGYAYSDTDTPNFNAPIAIELYTQGSMLRFYPENMCGTTDPNGNYLSDYGTLYLVGVYSPLTCLSGSCTIEENFGEGKEVSEYVSQILNGTSLLPQIDYTTIIFSYGEVEEENCRGFTN